MPHYRFTDPQLSLLTASSKQNRFRSAANVHLDAPRPSRLPTANFWSPITAALLATRSAAQEADNFAPELTAWQQAAHADSFPARHDACDPGLHCRKNPPAALVWSGVEDAAVHLAPAQIDALTTACCAHRPAQDMPRALTVPAKPPSNYQPRAGGRLCRSACFSCHAINGRGGDMAPTDLEGSRCSGRVAGIPEKSRHVAAGADPPHAAVQPLRGDAAELADYIMTVYQNPAFDRDSMPNSGYPPRRWSRGNSSSIPNMPARVATSSIPRPTKGYVGPTLTQVVRG